MIKFQKFYVTNGEVKAKVSYSAFNMVSTGQPCVTLYAQDYSRALGKVFADKYENDTDLMTDYFDQGRVRFVPGDALYEAALARCKQNDAEREAKYAAKQALYAAKRAAAQQVAA